MFRDVLKARQAGGAIRALDYLSSVGPADWQGGAREQAKQWRKDINDIARDWARLNDTERFAVLQQVGSVLRTSLVADLESRSR